MGFRIYVSDIMSEMFFTHIVFLQFKLQFNTNSYMLHFTTFQSGLGPEVVQIPLKPPCLLCKCLTLATLCGSIKKTMLR